MWPAPHAEGGQTASRERRTAEMGDFFFGRFWPLSSPGQRGKGLGKRGTLREGCRVERVAGVAKRTEWSFITVTQGQYCFWLNLARKAPDLGSASCKLLAKGTDKGREESARKEPLHSSFTPTPNCPAEQSRAAGLKIKGGRWERT